jgi:hypothetical protein
LDNGFKIKESLRFKKLLIAFIALCSTISYPLWGQSISNYNLEIGLQPSIFLLQNTLAKNHITIPLNTQVYYWRDFANTRYPEPLEAWQKNDYRTICNRAYNYPFVGGYLSFISNFHQDIGYATTFGLSTDIGVFQTGRSYLSFRPKVGLSYFSNIYDPIQNPDNELISSHFNANLGLGIYYTMQKPIKTLKIGAEINHFSNGSMTKPNLGINLFSLGLSYQFGPEIFPWSKEERKTMQDYARAFPDTNAFAFQLGGFSKQFNKDSKKYLGGNFIVRYNQQLNLWLDTDAKLLFSYDPSRNAEYKLSHSKEITSFRMGIALGLVLKFHRFNLHLSPGIYLVKPEKDLDKAWFQQYQIDYELNKKIFTFASLLAHYGTADYLDFGVGYKL